MSPEAVKVCPYCQTSEPHQGPTGCPTPEAVSGYKVAIQAQPGHSRVSPRVPSSKQLLRLLLEEAPTGEAQDKMSAMYREYAARGDMTERDLCREMANGLACGYEFDIWPWTEVKDDRTTKPQ